MTDSHERWTIHNLSEARDAELRCPHGSQVQVGQDELGHWYVNSGGLHYQTMFASETAALLNQHGVLTKEEHEAHVLEESL